jgi:hypothetical protein
MTSKISLLQALNDPESLFSLGLEQWDLVVRQARRANLLSRLGVLLRSKGELKRVPDQVRPHLIAECNLADQQQRVMKWELHCLMQVLGTVNIPVILLKGAAYVAAGLPPAQGRRFSDVDILVPTDRLKAAEKVLFLNGWFAEKQNPYDQQYYRLWMHELPPLRHVRRRTVLDVHHAIVPLTMRLHPNPKKLIANTVVAGAGGQPRVLAPVDMVLHSAAHLFLDGEFQNALRDLVDLDLLLREFSAIGNFWDDLFTRSVEMELTRPMYYAASYLVRYFQTPIPESTITALKAHAPGLVVNIVMKKLLDRAITVHHPSCDDSFSGLARFILYVRGHYLRMPMYLLIPHLIRKTLRDKQPLPEQVGR